MEDEPNASRSVTSVVTATAEGTSSSTSLLRHNLLENQDEDEEDEENDQTIYHRLSMYITSRFRHDLCSFLIVCFTLWLFVSMTVIFGFYGSEELPLGPYISCPVQANSLFVQSIKLVEMDGPKDGVVLFEFPEPPSLEVEINWSEIHNVFVQSRHHMEWPHYLNKGSKVEITYSVNSPVYEPLSLVIAQGKEKLLTWAEDPWHPSTTLSWNLIYGNEGSSFVLSHFKSTVIHAVFFLIGTGVIQQIIAKSDIYYIALSNSNREEAEVYLNFTMKAYVYNTSYGYHRCSLSHHECSVKLSVTSENFAILTSPGPDQVEAYDKGYIILSYGPRWITYFVGSGIVTILLILVSRIYSVFDITRRDQTHFQSPEQRFVQSSLLSRNKDDGSSWDSSYESITHEEEELDKLLAAAGIVDRDLCVVCFNTSRDCFFLPCGHSATCITCGNRILEDVGDCPICRRTAKKLRRIINV